MEVLVWLSCEIYNVTISVLFSMSVAHLKLLSSIEWLHRQIFFLQFLLLCCFFVCSSWAVKGELNNQQQTFYFIFLTRYSRVHSFVLREQQQKKVVKWEREWNEILIKVVLRVDFAFHWKYKDKFKVEIEYNMLLKLSVCSRSCSICTNPFDKTINHRSVGWSTSTAFCL